MDAQSITLDTVYPVIYQNNRVYSDIARSIEITGGTVDIYVSNAADEPANAAAMTEDQTGVQGMIQVTGAFRWILVSSASGTPVVTALGLIKGE